jgi:hypothetical protein
MLHSKTRANTKTPSKPCPKPPAKFLQLTILLLILLTGTLLVKKTGILWDQETLQGAYVALHPHPHSAPAPQLEELTTFLHGQRVNRINQRRNPHLLKTHPELFGPNKPFKPLLKILASGPSTVWIHSTSSHPITPAMTIPIPEGSWEIEIYPDYQIPRLFEGISGEKESLKIEFASPQTPKHLAHQLNLEWSGPNDIFLSTESLIDLASLVQTEAGRNPLPPETLTNWTQSLPGVLEKTPIRYQYDAPEHHGTGTGWQSVRTKDQMIQEEKATCLDITAWIAKEALARGLKPYILANSGHTLCAIAEKEGTLDQALPIEGTDLLKAPLKPQAHPNDPPIEFQPHEPLPEVPRTIPPEEPPQTDIFQIDIRHWGSFYLKSPTKAHP